MSVHDIPIGISIKVEDAPYAETIQRLDEVMRRLDELGKRTTEMASRGLSNLGGNMNVVNESLKETGGDIEVAGKSFKQTMDEAVKSSRAMIRSSELVSDIQNKVIETFDKLSLHEEVSKRETQLLSQSTGRYSGLLKTLASRYDLLESYAGKLGMTQEQFRSGIVGSAIGLQSYNITTALTNELVQQMATYSQHSANVQEFLRTVLIMTSDAFTLQAEKIREGTITVDELTEAHKRADLMLKNLEATTRDTTNRLAQISEMNRRFYAQLGPAGVALEQFTRELFWLGLGLMFTTMSVARLARRQTEAQQSAFSLFRAQLRVSESTREYNETVMLYGRNSEEARNANIRLVESQMALDSQLLSTRDAIMQQYLATGMLVFGMFPSMLRIGSSVVNFLEKKGIIEKLGISITTEATGAQLLKSGAEVVGAGTASNLATASYGAAGGHIAQGTAALFAAGALKVLIGVATMGIGLLVSWAISSMLADQQMAELEKRAKELEEQLTKHSLVDSLRLTTLEVNSTTESISKLSGELSHLPLRSHSPLEVKTVAGGWTEIGKVGEIEGLGSTQPSQVVVQHIYGPWYVKEEVDYQKVANVISDRIMRDVYSVRGKY